MPHPQDVDRSGVRSPSPKLTTSLLKNVLLGNEIEDDLGPLDRVRVSSISGRPVRQDGVGIVIGNESSSESEDEADDTCKQMLLQCTCRMCRCSSLYSLKCLDLRDVLILWVSLCIWDLVWQATCILTLLSSILVKEKG